MYLKINLVFTSPASIIKTLKITSLLTATLFFAINVFAAPIISDFAPASGPVGSLVVITGSGFNVTTSQNVVFFGATSATVISASANSLTVTVPAASTFENISVTNLAVAQTGYSAKPFIVTLNGGGIFRAKKDFTTGTAPDYHRHVDLDDDTWPDVVVVNRNSNTISVLPNWSLPGTGNFGEKLDFATTSMPYGLAIGDLDGDGKPDVAVTCLVGQTLSIFRNTSTPGAISFVRADFPSAFGYQPAIADFDGDGKPDVAVSDGFNNNVMIFRNISAGAGSVNFAPRVTFPAGAKPYSLASGDLDGDGKTDLVTANSDGYNVSVLRNVSTVGNISFAAKSDIIINGADPEACVIGDIDGDGKPEVATANYGSGSLSILPNTSTVGSISFGTHKNISAPGNPYGLGMGDINGDGKPDLAAAVPGVGLVTYMNLSGPGAIRFSAETVTPGASNSLSVTIGDLDKDSRPDVSVANFGAASLSLFLQARFPHIITGISPLSGPVGSSVIISGSGFSATAAQNIVYFGATRATVTAATSAQLTVTVPPGSTYQLISVTNLATNQVAFADKIFNVTLDGSFSFNPKQDLALNEVLEAATVGDLDGDGKPDLVMVTGSSWAITVLRNTSAAGAVSFAPKQDFGVGNAQTVTIGEINGDGKPDLVVCFSANNKSIEIYRNTSVPGTISFAAPVNLSSALPYARNTAIDDIDGDGKADLAVAPGNDRVFILRNLSTTSTISFAEEIAFTTPNYSSGIALGDIDGDGKPDLAVTNDETGSMSLLRNISFPGAIDFAAKMDFVTGTSPGKLVMADIDGDAKSDLSVVGTDNISVFRNASTPGSFSLDAKVDFATPLNPRLLGIGDIDGDGKPDFALPNNYPYFIALFKNTSTPGSISFGSRLDLITPANPQAAAIADMDGDGKPDISVVSASGSLSVFRQIAFIAPPVITDISPLKGPVGSSVVISGTGFNAAAAENTVFFGATKAIVTAAAATSLTVTVPLGSTYQPLSLTNMATHLTAFADKAFNVTLLGGTGFSPKQDLALSAGSRSVAIGDLDSDGKPDLAMMNSSASPITVIRNVSAGGVVSFDPKQDFGSGTQRRNVAIGDLDGDGKPDLAVAFLGVNGIEIHQNTSVPGTISFAPAIVFNSNLAYAQDVAIDDIDGDGKPDLAVAVGYKIAVYRNLSTPGTISFDTENAFTVPNYSYAICLGDIDGDGKPDLGLTSDQTGSISLFRNTSIPGAIGFAAKTDFVTGTNPSELVFADIDGDGRSDVSVAARGSNLISVFRNTSAPGAISLAAKVDFATQNYPGSLSVGDVTGDGKPDLAATNYNSTSTSLLKNISTQGNIQFATRNDYPTTTYSESVAIGDIDLDGRPDLSVVSFSGFLSVLKQLPAVPPPTAVSSQSFCVALSPKVSDLVAIGTDIKWYSSENQLLAPTTPLVQGGNYQASQTINGVESEQRRTVIVTILAVDTESTWYGFSNDWNHPVNWSTATVPNACTNVIINAGLDIVMPIVTGQNAVCNKLTLNNGATITVAAGAKLLISKSN